MIASLSGVSTELVSKVVDSTVAPGAIMSDVMEGKMFVSERVEVLNIPDMNYEQVRSTPLTLRLSNVIAPKHGLCHLGLSFASAGHRRVSAEQGPASCKAS